MLKISPTKLVWLILFFSVWKKLQFIRTTTILLRFHYTFSLILFLIKKKIHYSRLYYMALVSYHKLHFPLFWTTGDSTPLEYLHAPTNETLDFNWLSLLCITLISYLCYWYLTQKSFIYVWNLKKYAIEYLLNSKCALVICMLGNIICSQKCEKHSVYKPYNHD